MEFIVKLVSIQHPVLIPKGALLNTENKLRVDGEVGKRGKWVMGIEEGTS